MDIIPYTYRRFAWLWTLTRMFYMSLRLIYLKKQPTAPCVHDNLKGPLITCPIDCVIVISKHTEALSSPNCNLCERQVKQSKQHAVACTLHALIWLCIWQTVQVPGRHMAAGCWGYPEGPLQSGQRNELQLDWNNAAALHSSPAQYRQWWHHCVLCINAIKPLYLPLGTFSAMQWSLIISSIKYLVLP